MKRAIILLLFIVYSCDTNPSITIQVVETTTKLGVCFGHGIKTVEIKKSQTALIDSDFNIDLKFIPDKGHYIAKKHISCCLERCEGDDDSMQIITEIYIIDHNKNAKIFSSINEFVDFMSAANYEMVDEENRIDYTEFIFKKII